MKFIFGGEEHEAFDFALPFRFNDVVFAQGGLIIVKPDGSRTAVTREHFDRWWVGNAALIARGSS